MQIGKYELREKIGEGGMGKIFRAVSNDGHIVAIKLSSDITDDHDLAKRFQREAELLKRLKDCPYIVTYLGHGVAHNFPYIIMELLEGKSLWTYLQSRGGCLPQTEALALIKQVCAGMIYVHDLGILHRDLKPDNIFVVKGSDGEPFIKILDFGLAKDVTDNAAPAITQVFTKLGTPVYMPPEQHDDASSVDERADVFTLGRILFHLLAGHDAYPDGCVAGVAYAKLSSMPDDAIWDVVIRAVNPDLTHRQRSVREFWEQLELAAAPVPVIPPAPLVANPSSALASTVPKNLATFKTKIVSVVLALLVVFVGFVVEITTLTDRLWDRHAPESSRPTSTTYIVAPPTQPLTVARLPEPTPPIEPLPLPRLPTPTILPTTLPASPPPVAQPRPTVRASSPARPRTSLPAGVNLNPDGSCCDIPNRSDTSLAQRRTICAFLQTRHLVCPDGYDQ